MSEKTPKKLNLNFQVIYLVILGILATIPYWPVSLWWLANLIDISPLWVFFLPLIFFVLTGAWKDKIALRINAASFLIVLFLITGFKISIPSGAGSKSDFSLKLMTANMGDIKDLNAFLDLVRREQPDMVAFQELNSEQESHLKNELSGSQWDWAAEGRLGLLSRYPIRSTEIKDRRPLGGWGEITIRYDVETPVGLVHIFSVHLATPREGVSAFVHHQKNAVSEMQRVTLLQEQESIIASHFTASFQPAIVIGDFNMLQTNPIFKKYWSGYRDAFSQKGFGFGHTKHTRIYGARIDHVLYDPSWKAVQAKVGPDTGGDHRPLIARLIFTAKH